MLTNEQMYEIVRVCDQAYDGLFYYGVKSTGIVCRPSCRSKTPKRTNVIFYTHLQTALKQGFRPCKRCQPEMLETTPERMIVEALRRMLEEEYSTPSVIAEVSARLGVSLSHSSRLFKKAMAVTPVQYVNSLRLQKAAELLCTTRQTNTEICLAVGFRSLSSFYDAFRKEYGIAPGALKKQIQGENNDVL